jgi:hypothetical protein
MTALLRDYHYNQRHFAIYFLDCYAVKCHDWIHELDTYINEMHPESPIHLLVNEDPNFVT